MRSRMIAIAVGFAVALLQPQLLPVTFSTAIVTVIAPLLILAPRIRSSHLIFFLVSFLYVNLWGVVELDQRLPESLKRTDWKLRGVITEIPRHQQDVVRFSVDVEDIEGLQGLGSDDYLKVQRVSLAWYQPDLTLSLGDQVELTARLKPPHGLVNPAGFDYERWLLARGVDATGYVRGQLVVVSDADSWVSRARIWINDSIQTQFETQQSIALFQALTTGTKSILKSHDWDLLKHSGVVHLAVISGLHIGFMAFCGWWIGRLAGVVFYSVSYQHQFPYMGALALAAFYLLISGMGIPAQRAFIMLLVLLITGSRMFYLDHWTRWWIAFVVVLFFNPISFFEVGFWLSFSAVALLIWISQFYRGWRMALNLQFMLMIGMLPIYLFYFSGVSVIAPFFNLIAIPFFSVLVPLLFLHLGLSAVGMELLMPVLNCMSDVFWWTVQWNQKIETGYWQLDTPNVFVLILAVLVAVCLLLLRLTLPLSVILILLVPAVVGSSYTDKGRSEFRAWVYDVGQGLSVRVQIGEYHLLYDTGPSYRSGGTAFERAVLPDFQKANIDSIDHLVLSHSDNDHAGGATAVFESTKVGRVITSYPYMNAEVCAADHTWQVDGVKFTFLAGMEGSNDNDRSCVLMIESQNCRLLLPGDIGAQKEHEIIPKVTPGVDWLVASHHGSKTSSSSLFINSINPSNVIFSAGYANAFGHPHPDVVKRFLDSGVKTYETAKDGAIMLIADAHEGCKTITMREDEKRFWRSF
ncbi:DNA internalization-related competence protein ComEC/Rec2 [Neptuniibacter sp. SY11_33]|uniref:DNA internalization-related competence protein ComEC/Rec2 n=1 Tax=Neptuniibacter sp. SY11_33 TaxID=3398215 RepID=UPI0039F49327